VAEGKDRGKRGRDWSKSQEHDRGAILKIPDTGREECLPNRNKRSGSLIDEIKIETGKKRGNSL